MLLNPHKLNFNQIAFTLLFLGESYEKFDMTKKEFLDSLGAVLTRLNVDQLLAFKDFYTQEDDKYFVTEQQWKNMKDEIVRMSPGFSNKGYQELSDEEKEVFKASWKEKTDYYEKFLLITISALASNKITEKKIDQLYQTADSIGLAKGFAQELLIQFSTHNRDILRMLSNMSSRARVLSYLYTVQLFLKNENKLFDKEKDFLKNVRKAYNLEFAGTQFWSEYLSYRSQDESFYERNLGENSLKRFIAVMSILIHVKDDPMQKVLNKLAENEKLDAGNLKETLDEMGIKTSDIEKVQKEQRDEDYIYILEKLNTKEIVHVLNIFLYDSWQDKNISDGEIKILNILSGLLNSRDEQIEGADTLYLLFLSVLLQNLDLCQYEDGKVVKKLNKVLSKYIKRKAPLRLMIYALETFQNANGVEYTEEELRAVLDLLTDKDELKNTIIKDCLHSETPQAQKRYLLLSLMKVEYLLKNEPSESVAQTIINQLESLPTPEIAERNFVAYFMLRGMYTDQKLDEKEMEYFDQVKNEINASDLVTQAYKDFLYLETGIKFDNNQPEVAEKIQENSLGKSKPPGNIYEYTEIKK